MDLHPVSYQQEALFENQHSGPSCGVPNSCIIAQVQRRVYATLTREVLDRIVKRHPILRTVYTRRGAALEQCLIPDAVCDSELVDARSWDSEMLADRLDQESRKPFDLERGPIFRARLYSQSERQHTLLLCTHPIAADRQALRILLDDFESISEALVKGGCPQIEQALGGYFDYACEQRQMLETERGRAMLEFWRDQVSSDLPVLSLPVDRVRPEHLTYASSTVPFQVPRDLSREIERLARQQGHAVQSICLAAYAILLSRYGGSERVSIGWLSSDRDTARWENVVGNFANVAIVSADCTSQSTFTQLLRQVSEAAANVKAHQNLPLVGLAKELGLSQPPFCQASFGWEQAEGSGGPAETIEAVRFCEGPGELGLRVFLADGTIHGTWLYSSELFDGETAARMTHHWIELLRSIAASPEDELRAFDLMSAEEHQWVMARCQGAATDYPRRCLHELFAEQAAGHPNAEAVVYGSQRLTYGQLDQRSNRIANYLRSQGLAADERVGIFMEPSVDMIVSMLAIVKAGGAYVPLDPSYPAERLQFLVNDIVARWVLTHRQVQAQLPASAALVWVDEDNPAISGASDAPVANLSTPESTAMLIFTSGSTGRPKGACLPHRAAVRLVRNTNFVEITRTDRVAQVVSPSFDVCIFEVWSALVNGATLVGVPRQTLLTPSQMADLLRTERISVLFITTAYLLQIGRDTPDLLKDVRAVIFGGEAAEPGPIRNIVKHGKPGTLTNVYGPVEGGVVATYYEIRSVADDARTVPIGRPISNAQVYLLDSWMQPVPIGLPGELYLGGEGIALGYSNRPELNAERFLSDPFSGRPGALLYRTGDLARLCANGDFEFIGRIDHQVKIRGYRIELPEVQLAVASHPDVKHAFVMVREDQPGDKRLVAYVTLRRPPSPCTATSEMLRQHVKDKLPAYMVPAAIILMETIPLTPNGKVDRKALPAPWERPQMATAYEQPETDLERIVTSIWEKVLGVGNIGVNDSFFDLGGHSLLAARLITQIEKETGHNIPVATLFEAPTVAQLAQKLKDRTYKSAWSPLVQLHAAQGGGRAAPFFCIHSLGANLVSLHHLSALLRSDRPVYGLQPHGLDGCESPLHSVEQMAAAYLRAIREQRPQGPYYIGGVCLGGVVAYEIAQQLHAAGEQVALLLLIDSYLPGPLQYQHVLSNWIDYLDRHLGEMLLLPPAKAVKYLARWAANGFVRAGWALGYRQDGPLARATKRVIDANAHALAAYRPKPYTGKVTQIICADGPHRSYDDRRLAWSTLAEGGFELHITPGNHLTMVEQPHLSVLAHQLQLCLDRATVEPQPASSQHDDRGQSPVTASHTVALKARAAAATPSPREIAGVYR